MKELHKFGLVRFSKKSGKIDTSMTALGCGLIQLWALQNTTKSKACVIINLDTREIHAEYEGKPGGFPEVRKKPEAFVFDVPAALIEQLLTEDAKRESPA